ncbi:hypothetical protein SGPA1_11034 [Streptomyces misionensis JCM 4497]
MRRQERRRGQAARGRHRPRGGRAEGQRSRGLPRGGRGEAGPLRRGRLDPRLLPDAGPGRPGPPGTDRRRGHAAGRLTTAPRPGRRGHRPGGAPRRGEPPGGGRPAVPVTDLAGAPCESVRAVPARRGLRRGSRCGSRARCAAEGAALVVVRR